MSKDDDNAKGRGGSPPEDRGDVPRESSRTLSTTPIKIPSLPETDPGSQRAEALRDLRRVLLGGRYTLEARVNGGNMGEIWRASDNRLPHKGDHWLVKILPSVFAGAKAYTEALVREAHITSGLNGDYFPLIVDVGVTDGVAYLVMQGLPGEDLASFLETHHSGGMQANEAIPLLKKILEGLSMAHEKGVIHRDIKPENLLVEHVEGKPPKVRILDFGVAKAQSEVFATLSKTLPQGTQQYRPPESHRPIPGPATPGGDVFAVGLTAYQMLLGRHPFSTGSYIARYKRGEELGALHADRAGVRAGVDAAFGAVLSKAVAFDPNERYQDASEMLEALEFATTFRAEAIPKGAIIDGSYRVLSSLGAGGMGSVYNVEDIHRKKDEQLLLKVLVCPPGASDELRDSFRERFRRECESLYTVEHECIPRIFSNGSHEGVPYLVMERAEGHALFRCFDVLFAKGGWDAVFRMCAGVASALDTIHSRGLVHRDIKPPNIVVDPSTARVMVIDFGIVRVDDTALTGDDVFIGTSGYAAPEQMAGEAVKESDQWSLGATLYNLLSGVRPGDLQGEPPEKGLRVLATNRLLSEDYPPLAALEYCFPVPASVVSSIDKAMSHDPSDRFPSVSAFVSAMQVGVTNSDAPSAPQHGLRPSDTVSAAPHSEGSAITRPHTPQARAGSTVATTDVVMRQRSRGTRAAIIAAGVLLIAGGGAYALRASSSDSGSVHAGEPTGEPSAPASAQPLAAATVADASVPRPPPRMEVTSVNVPVLASFQGELVADLVLGIGDDVIASSDSLTLPLGENVVHIGEGRFRGAYTCVMTLASEACDLELKEVQAKPRRRPRTKRKIDDGEEDMINFREKKP